VEESGGGCTCAVCTRSLNGVLRLIVARSD
jgi:hypothetical protein